MLLLITITKVLVTLMLQPLFSKGGGTILEKVRQYIYALLRMLVVEQLRLSFGRMAKKFQ